MNKKLSLIAIVFLSLFVCIKLYSQNEYNDTLLYKTEWKIVDSLFARGLPKSSLEVVDKIYENSKINNHYSHIIKALIYKVRLTEDLKDKDKYVNSIKSFNDEISISGFPLKNILHSLTADLYSSYLNMYKYKIQGRTKLKKIESDDIETWDLKTFYEKIIFHLQNSLIEPERLQKISLDNFNSIIINNSFYTTNVNARFLRPTLYDFLAHKAANYFLSNDPDITKPAVQFELNSDKYFQPSSDFVNYQIPAFDSISFKYYTIKLLQDLLKFHINDNSPDALIDADLKRLSFVHLNSTLDNKDALYLKALEDMENKYKDYQFSSEISYDISVFYSSQGAKYNYEQDSIKYKWENKKSIEICNNIISKYPESVAAKNARSHILDVMVKNIDVTNEKYTIPGKLSLASISYKNIKKVYFKIIKTSYDEIEETKITPSDYAGKNYILDYFSKKSSINQFSYDLPYDEDYQNHRIEVKIPALEKGCYIILVCPNESFDINNGAVAYSFLKVTNISYLVKTEYARYNSDVYVLDRNTGVPLSDVKSEIWSNEYDYSISQYVKRKVETYYTDVNGHFTVPSIKGNSYSYEFRFTKDDDELVTDDYFYKYSYEKENNKENIWISYFTDRAIYRPGQLIYFKGIVMGVNNGISKIKKNFPVKIIFKDVNYKEVSSLDLKTNEYGSVNGTFIAPLTGLTGQMSISSTSSYDAVYFSVEEYKIPKFEVKFDDVKGSYKLNETVKVKGFAKTYAGSNLDNAKVQFKVIRRTSFPQWWYYWRGYYPESKEVIIKIGETITDANGDFYIDFTAVPDLNVPKESKPTFSYTVAADVTDINGETRSANLMVAVGYNALKIDFSVPSIINTSDKPEYRFVTTNLNGTREPALCIVEVFILKSPSGIHRSRLWQKPNKFLYSKDEFYKYFPEDLYYDEMNTANWEKDNKVDEISINTAQDSVLYLSNLANWAQGVYKIESKTKDIYGEDVFNYSYVVIFNPASREMPYSSVDWFYPLKSSYEPGEIAKILIGSSEKNMTGWLLIKKDENIIRQEWVKLSNNQLLIEIPVTEEYRGNFAVEFFSVNNNRYYSHELIIDVPYTNKELNISIETFRDKLLSGEQETWKLKIKGKQGDKVAAEMLASMYDASLDAFRQQSWYFNPFKYYYPGYYWTYTNCFSYVNSVLVQDKWNEYLPKIGYSYDEINWYGYVYNYYFGYKGMYLDGTSKIRGGREVTTEILDFEQSGIVEDERMKDKTKKEEKKNGDIKNKDKEGEKGDITTKTVSDSLGNVLKQDITLRKNFNETAFFYPDLQTNENGEVIISFKAPESLTRWKFLGLAHTQDLKVGWINKELVTQKDLMVFSNPPRFLRESDTIHLNIKVTNNSDRDLSGNAELKFFNALNMQSIDNLLANSETTKSFSVNKGLNTSLEWIIVIPSGLQAVTYQVKAKTESFSDGEEITIPVLTNRMLVTESLPMNVKGNTKKTYRFDKLIDNTSTTLSNYKFTLEFTSNPVWYAVQALPYLMEYPYECLEQTFSRFYANSIAVHIANSDPKIKAVFDSWKNITPNALMSNLEKNQELKNLLLNETPWVREAQNESERKKRIAVLFDLNRMSNELEIAQDKILKGQVASGGWPWFAGLPEDRYMSQHILAGFGKLNKLGVKKVFEDQRVNDMINKAVGFIDKKISEDYLELKRQAELGYIKLSDDHLSGFGIHYLYTRSFFTNIPLNENYKEAYNYFIEQSQKYWVKKGLYYEGMIALYLFRNSDNATPQNIIKSLREYAITNDEFGMYWKYNSSYWWYEAPIETQSLLIELFSEVEKDENTVDDMKIWLLKQKQTNDWKTTKATVEAIYALLLRGSKWISSDLLVDVSLGFQKIEPLKIENLKVEAGTGYFKTSWSGGDIKPEMGNVVLDNKNPVIGWGAVYWQYFENLDKITNSLTNLNIDKKLFIQ
jgi:hypothetical protein